LPLHAINNESELLRQVADGNERAFTELFYAYHGKLGEFVLMLTGSKELTQEIIQDVFLKVWHHRESLPALENFVSWLFILTRNYTLNSLRRLANEKKNLRIINTELYTRAFTDDKIIEKDYQQLLEQAIASLPPQQQRAYKMSREQGLDNDYISKQLGVSPDSVKKYLQWAQQSIVRFVRSHAGLMVILLLGGRL
jgi:RNA polymerase sigma-70 factor (ECF subfamily)